MLAHLLCTFCTARHLHLRAGLCVIPIAKLWGVVGTSVVCRQHQQRVRRHGITWISYNLHNVPHHRATHSPVLIRGIGLSLLQLPPTYVLAFRMVAPRPVFCGFWHERVITIPRAQRKCAVSGHRRQQFTWPARLPLGRQY